ncbi:hypothetical protein KCU83_g113, partial [Aureobasidium melanogenum]
MGRKGLISRMSSPTNLLFSKLLPAYSPGHVLLWGCSYTTTNRGEAVRFRWAGAQTVAMYLGETLPLVLISAQLGVGPEVNTACDLRKVSPTNRLSVKLWWLCKCGPVSHSESGR